MPHLSYDHSAELSSLVAMDDFAQHLRAAMAASGLFPLGGIRVRGHAASSEAVADGRPGWLWLDMQLRIGTGRSEADRQRAVELLYAAARDWLEPRLAGRPFALSFELREIDQRFSAKGWNTIHSALQADQRQ